MNAINPINEQDWRALLKKSMKAVERTKIERVKMPELAPNIRNKNNEEVNLGLVKYQALLEAKRCLDCANPTCMKGCPVNIDIPLFIKNIERGNFLEAAATLKETSTLPAVCGRVCPQEKQCESQCIYTQKMNKEAVAVGYLERFAADYERMQGEAQIPTLAPSNGIKMAVVGSGPAGLACAADLAKRGFLVTVFEALHEIGGVLKYGIPEFRLPNSIVDFEIKTLRNMGIEFQKNCVIGKTISFEDLEAEGYAAFFVCSGAGLPRFMNISGENLVGVMSANEYLTRVNLMNATNAAFDTPVLSGKTIMVVGGGNTAMDAVRTAIRSGARAIIAYRRTEEEMPAREEEIKHAKEEGVEFFTLCNPICYKGNDQGRVIKACLQVMELGAPDDSGRRSPQAKAGEVIEVDVDVVIVSVGVSPNPIVPQALPQLKVSKWGTIEVNEQMQSSIPNVFAGGDIVRGGATVILAMGDGRKAAAAMEKYALCK